MRTCFVCKSEFYGHNNGKRPICPSCRPVCHREAEKMRMRARRASGLYKTSPADIERITNWKIANADRARENKRLRNLERSRKMYGGDRIKLRDWTRTLAAFNNTCAYCGNPWKHREHIIPVAMGGGFTKLNMVPACEECNYKKSDLNPFAFAGAPEAHMRLLEIHL